MAIKLLCVQAFSSWNYKSIFIIYEAIVIMVIGSGEKVVLLWPIRVRKQPSNSM